MIYLNKSDFSLVYDLNRFQDLGHAWQILSACKGIQPNRPGKNL